MLIDRRVVKVEVLCNSVSCCVEPALGFSVSITQTDGMIWVWCKDESKKHQHGVQVPIGELVDVLDALIVKTLKKNKRGRKTR